MIALLVVANIASLAMRGDDTVPSATGSETPTPGLSVTPTPTDSLSAQPSATVSAEPTETDEPSAEPSETASVEPTETAQPDENLPDDDVEETPRTGVASHGALGLLLLGGAVIASRRLHMAR